MDDGAKKDEQIEDGKASHYDREDDQSHALSRIRQVKKKADVDCHRRCLKGSTLGKIHHAATIRLTVQLQQGCDLQYDEAK